MMDISLTSNHERNAPTISWFPFSLAPSANNNNQSYCYHFYSRFYAQ